MSRVLVVRPDSDSAESAESPEFRYLISWCLLQARDVFDEVVVADGELRGQARGVDAVLLLGSPNVLLGRRSLAALWDALRAGCAEARPYRLADLGAHSPVYTLRGYEQVEEAFLAHGPATDAPVPASSLPVALLTPARFEDPASSGELAAAGIFHEFIDYYGEVRSDVIPLLPHGVRDVLEVGCGRGATGRLIQDTFGCRVTGIELNPVVAREAARHLHRVLQGDVQTVAIEGRFDAVLALELVEHLVETERFLARVRQLLAPGGRAIFSIPNVGHYSVVEDLIAGRWDYLPVGLLCYTHFRFFTRRTLVEWLRRSGIERFEIVSQRTEPPERPERFTGQFETDLESLGTKGFYVLVDG